jgi:hypothetical protein
MCKLLGGTVYRLGEFPLKFNQYCQPYFMGEWLPNCTNVSNICIPEPVTAGVALAVLEERGPLHMGGGDRTAMRKGMHAQG